MNDLLEKINKNTGSTIGEIKTRTIYKTTLFLLEKNYISELDIGDAIIEVDSNLELLKQKT